MVQHKQLNSTGSGLEAIRNVCLRYYYSQVSYTLNVNHPKVLEATWTICRWWHPWRTHSHASEPHLVEHHLLIHATVMVKCMGMVLMDGVHEGTSASVSVRSWRRVRRQTISKNRNK